MTDAGLRAGGYPLEVVRRVTARIDREALAVGVARAYREQLPSFARLPWDGDGGLLPAVRAGLDELFALLLEEEAPAAAEVRAPAENLIAEMVLEVTARDTIAGLGTAGRMVWLELLRAATPEELGNFAAIGGRMFLYLGGASRVARESTRARLEPGVDASHRALIELLVDPDAPDSRVQDAARTFGLRADDDWRPLVAIPGRGQTTGVLAVDLRARGYPAAAHGGQVLAVVPGRARVLLPSAPALVVLGAPSRLVRLAGEFAAVRALARIARAYGREGVVEAADLPLELLLASNPELAARLEERVIGRLRDHDDRRGVDLVRTLITHLRCDFDRSRTAASLHLHPNSLGYRLRRIGELTGLDPARSDDLLVMVLGATAHVLRTAA